MELGPLLTELEIEFDRTDFDISATHLISGLIQNLFQEKGGIVTQEELAEELKLITANLKEYCSLLKKEDIA